jgi:carboxymethylenebutenolidase
MEGQTNANNPKHPIDLVASLTAPVLGLYGGADTGIPVTSVNHMKEALAQAADKGNKAAKASEFVVYPDAPHAFHADYRPSFRAAPATDGWRRAIAWMKQYV